MTLPELVTTTGLILGPVLAVLISLWIEARRRKRDQRLQLLRGLLSTRMLPADPNYVVSINLIPLEFNRCKPVMQAWREYIETVRYQPAPGNEATAFQQFGAKQTALIFAIAKKLEFNISEGEIQTQGYISQAFSARDDLYLDSLKALRDIADATKRSAEFAERLVPTQK